jgi:hypothetical protein
MFLEFNIQSLNFEEKREARKPVKTMVLAFFYVVASNQIIHKAGQK